MAFAVFNKHTLSVLRAPMGEYVNGIWTPQPEALFTVKASVQPAGPSDLQLLPEGRRNQRAYRIYTKCELRAEDRIVIFDEEYEVIGVARWENGLLPHWKAVASAVQREGHR